VLLMAGLVQTLAASLRRRTASVKHLIESACQAVRPRTLPFREPASTMRRKRLSRKKKSAYTGDLTRFSY
ncbi:hypothetical protein, partial [Silanimonas lenta]|uniref:hypothetical protein n=1 Tax=Silanimonas lenta TaxID=265429 RepID=UPI002FE1146C